MKRKESMINLFLIIVPIIVNTSYSFIPPTSFTNLKPKLKVKMSTNNIDIPPKEELEKLLEVAITASKKAGDIILGNKDGAEVTKVKANSRDLLTLIDPLCEQTIRDTILNQYPNHEFLGEEDVPPGAEASALAIDTKLKNMQKNKQDYLWIVDPIDGTTNFVHGMPLCMPSVALAYKGTIVVGVIYDPHHDEYFTAMKGFGAHIQSSTTPKQSIHVGEQKTIGDSVIAMGSPPALESMQMSLKGVQALMPKCRTIRMIGSAAIMLAWVACGRLTVYWEYDLSSWDIAAGVLLVQEAGGKFTGLSGEPWNLRTRKIIASCGQGNVHEEVIQVLNDAGVQ